MSGPESEGRYEAVRRVSAPSVRSLLSAPDPPVLLDIRPASERRFGHLPGDTWIPRDELPDRVGDLPRHRPIVVYSHLGDRGRELVEILRRAGLEDVQVLEGGVDDYARWVDPTLPRYGESASEGPVVQQFPNYRTGCLGHLLWDSASGEAIIIDPGRETGPYVHELTQRQLRLRAIVETHTHADHLSGHASLHLRTGAEIWVGRRSAARYPHRTLAEDDTIAFGGEVLRVRETPGHTRDHLALTVRGLVFTGDTLLPGSCGRTDLGDGDPNLLWESLQSKLLRLPDETEVLPAHYGPLHGLPAPERYSSTIGFERATNEAVRLASREEFLDYMTHGWPPKPPQFDEVVERNLSS